MKSLLARWRELAGRYAALSRRERILVALAAVALAAYLGQLLWVGPQYSRIAGMAHLSAQQEKELDALQAQIASLRAQAAVDPDAGVRRSLADVEARTAEVDARLQSFESALVPPQRMGAVLGNLLRQVRGVRLRSLRTLPAQALLAEGSSQGDGGRPAANMYRHGYELSIEGNYLDLAAYLAELERQPQQLLWQRASLDVEEYPTAVLTLRFFSLSLEKDWLAL